MSVSRSLDGVMYMKCKPFSSRQVYEGLWLGDSSYLPSLEFQTW